MKLRTSDLQGVALDWAVAKCEKNWAFEPDGCDSYSTDWALGGPIIEREKIAIKENGHGHWFAKAGAGKWMRGTSTLIAAMRCYVASRLGDEVEVPTDLAA